MKYLIHYSGRFSRSLCSISLASLFISWLFLQTSCTSSRKEESTAVSESELKERMADARKWMVRNERHQIDEFISRHGFIMDSTGTGLRYNIYSTGDGRLPKEHDAVVLAYRVGLLTGEVVYDVSATEPDTFRLAEGKMVNGLEEALYRMQEGSKARLVLPAHLAYGMTGDDNKIPGATPLYYEIHFIRINP